MNFPPADLAAQFYLIEAFDEVDETLGLGLEAGKEFGTFQTVGFIEQGIDMRDKNALGIDEGVAVAEDGLELFDGPERAPDAGGDADEAHGTLLEALGELEHVYEIFQDARDAAVVFGREDDETGGFEDGVGERMEGLRFLGVGGGMKNFGRKLGEIKHAEGDLECGIDFLDVPGDFARVAAGAVRADNERYHAGKNKGNVNSDKTRQ